MRTTRQIFTMGHKILHNLASSRLSNPTSCYSFPFLPQFSHADHFLIFEWSKLIVTFSFLHVIWFSPSSGSNGTGPGRLPLTSHTRKFLLCITVTESSPILSQSLFQIQLLWFLGGSAGKECACNAGDLGSIPALGRSPGGGHGNPLQYSCLENPHGQRSLASYSLWGHKEFDMTEWLSTYQFND